MLFSWALGLNIRGCRSSCNGSRRSLTARNAVHAQVVAQPVPDVRVKVKALGPHLRRRQDLQDAVLNLRQLLLVLRALHHLHAGNRSSSNNTLGARWPCKKRSQVPGAPV